MSASDTPSDAGTHLLMEEKWLQLSKLDKEDLLKNIFYQVLIHDQNRPAFVTEHDWRNLIKQSRVDSHKPTQYYIVLNMEGFAHRYHKNILHVHWFFKHSCTHTKMGKHCLIDSANLENFWMYLDFNLQAVLVWMSQQENVDLFICSLANLSI
jgi:hypothetical protein